MRRLRALGLAASVLATLVPGAAWSQWRSALYPVNWTPGFTDASGRFLHDFSYAGYRRGEAALPTSPPGPLIDASVAPYSADRSGAADATDAIQAALDAAGAAGGGVVFLPAGTYKITPRPGKVFALWLGKRGVVLRGAGPSQTHLFVAASDMRSKRALWVSPREAFYTWYWEPSDERSITADLVQPTRTLPLADVAGYKAGDWIVVRADATDAFIAEHGMTGTWTPDDLGGPIFYRQIEAVDVTAKTVTLDAPTRYRLLKRDRARIYRVPPHLDEVGLEHLSIGNLENTLSGTGDNDYDTAGTGAYQMHDSFLVYFDHVVNGWVRGVTTYRPAANARDVHLLSNAIRLDFSRSITVTDVHLQKPEYLGSGGNGYLFTLTGSDCLVTRSSATGARHAYSFSFMQGTGNVVHRSSAVRARLPVDFHQRLALANLLDNVDADGTVLEAAFRTCCSHGHGTTQSVIWNTNGLSYPSDQWLTKYIVDTQQFGWGYVIGTRGAATKVQARSGNGTDPVDFVEGAGTGATLDPQSLYEDQLARRLGVSNSGPVVSAGPDQTVTLPAGAPLAGAGTDDGRPNPPGKLTLSWTSVSGPAPVTFDDAASASTTARFAVAGTYTLKLTASDSALAASDEVTVTVLPAASSPDAGVLGPRDAALAAADVGAARADAAVPSPDASPAQAADAGASPSDASTPPGDASAPSPVGAAGCGCAASGSEPAWMALLLGAAALAPRRRERAGGAPPGAASKRAGRGGRP